MKGGQQNKRLHQRRKKSTITTIQEEATFTNKNFALYYQLILLLFLFYFLSTRLSVVMRTQRLVKNEYFVGFIDCTTSVFSLWLQFFTIHHLEK